MYVCMYIYISLFLFPLKFHIQLIFESLFNMWENKTLAIISYFNGKFQHHFQLWTTCEKIKKASLHFLLYLDGRFTREEGPHLHSQNWSPQIATQETEASTMALNYIT
jgi:hypothetical protein